MMMFGDGGTYEYPAEVVHQRAAESRAMRAENTCLREALQAIVDHGTTTEPPHECWAAHPGDCADLFREIARAALARAR